MGAAVLISRTECSAAAVRGLAAKGRDAGPDPDIHKVVRWRCVDLRAEMRVQFSVTVAERTIGKWLRALGLTRLQPRPYHPKHDLAAQGLLKKLR
jgi:hypothetical protein